MLWAMNQPLAHTLRHLQGKGSLPGDMAELFPEAGEEARQQPDAGCNGSSQDRERKREAHGEEQQSWTVPLETPRDLTTASLGPPDASLLLQDPEGCQLLLSGKTGSWLRRGERRTESCF